MSGPLIYLVAGEPSGDRLAAALMRGLKAEAPGVRFAGVGGPAMEAEGLASLFDSAELAVMGIAEVLPRLPALLRRIRQTAEDCASRAPDALVTVDAPSFGLRVAERVRRQAPAIRTIHYVAPSVWAWRPGRARHMGRFVDHVLALLPFEPPYMEAAGMTCDAVGHPIAERPLPDARTVEEMRARLAGEPVPLLLVAPGSRRGEIGRMLPVMAETVARLRASVPDLRLAVPVGERVADTLPERLAAAGLGDAALIRPEESEDTRFAAFAAADAALVKSGTISLEMAAVGTPHVSSYRTSWATAAIVRRLARIDTANLINLVVGFESGARPVPEFLQERAKPEAIAAAVAPLLTDRQAGDAQRAAFGAALDALGRGGTPPSLRAARSVLANLG